VNWFLQGTLATSFLKCGKYSLFDIDALSNGIPNRSNLLLPRYIFDDGIYLISFIFAS
jgi:hypothetical protein